MADDRPNTTNYTHPEENNLRNIHKAMEYNITATDTINTGINLLEGTFVGGSHGGATRVDLHEYDHGFQLRRQLDGTKEIFALCAIATTNNDDAVGTVAWQEFN